MHKSLNTLPQEVYALLSPDVDHIVNEDNLNTFAETLKDVIRNRLSKREESSGALRFSSIGKQDRQLWYDAHPDGSKEVLKGPTLVKFLYGDVIEALLLLLIKESGHTVEREQEEVTVLDVKGHIDAVVSGTVVDIKSASPYGFQKFKRNEVIGNDVFGYLSQLAGYSDVLTPGEEAAWIAMDKVSGEICVTKLSSSIISDNKPEVRIEHLKEVLSKETPPEKCYSDVEDGKSGNRKLVTGCSYCSHKIRCWPALRAYTYSTGPRYLTKVVREPDVPEFNLNEVIDDA